MLSFVFGSVQRNEAHLREPERAAGFLECERADVSWFLSVDRNDLPGERQRQENDVPFNHRRR